MYFVFIILSSVHMQLIDIIIRSFIMRYFVQKVWHFEWYVDVVIIMNSMDGVYLWIYNQPCESVDIAYAEVSNTLKSTIRTV